MNWITPTTFQADFKFAERMTTAQIQLALDAAVDEVVEYVGQAAVTDTLLASPADPIRAAKIVRGHTFLAAATALLNVRNVKREQDSNSPGTVKTINNEYWTPKEISDMAAQWRTMALRALAPYLTIEVAGDDYSPSVEFSNPTLPTCPNTCKDPCCSSSVVEVRTAW